METKVCLIAPEFYHYHTSIINSLVNKGHEVVFHPEMPNDFIHRMVKNISGPLYQLLLKKYFQRIFDELKAKDFNYFLFIRAEVIPVSFIESLKERFPTAKFIMYQWDSCTNNDYRRLLPFFDKISTFDPLDAKEFSIEYRPLFYIGNDHNHGKITRDIDFLFVGSMNPERIKQFRKFRSALPIEIDLNVVISLYVTIPSFIKYLLKTFDFRSLQEVSFKKISVDELNSLMARSKNIIDYSSAKQSGISVRSFEALASGARLITNNPTILNVFPQFSSAVDVVNPLFFNYLPHFSNCVDSVFIKNFVVNFEIDEWLDKVLE